MEISNWLNFIVCLDFFSQISPKRILDIGIATSRWGVLLKEFYADQRNELGSDEEKIILEGIEDISAVVSDYRRSLYNHIYTLSTDKIHAQRLGNYDLIFLGQALTTLERPVELIKWAVDHGNYICITAPPELLKHDEVKGQLPKNVWHISTLYPDFVINGKKGDGVDCFILSNFDLVSSNLSPRSLSPNLINLLSKNEYDFDLDPPSTSVDLEELRSIRSSRLYGLMVKFKESLPGKMALRVERNVKKACQLITRKNVNNIETPNRLIPRSKDSQAPLPDATPLSNDEEQWLSTLDHSRVVSLFNPDWMGISGSTRQLFKNTLEVRDCLDEQQAKHLAFLLKAAQLPGIVIQGFPLSYRLLLQQLNMIAPQIPVYLIWHGGFVQSDEDYNWLAFKTSLMLCKNGEIKKLGFVKKGMAEIMADKGYPTGFVMNYVQRIPQSPSIPMPNGPHIAIWASDRKRPFVSLAAVSAIPQVKIALYGYSSQRVDEYNRVMAISPKIYNKQLLHSEVLTNLSNYDLNLYISFYECTPMLPLESLSMGSPCLLGPNSHLFEDHPYLHSRLVVPYPDRAEVIARYVEQAIEERSSIIEAYMSYAPNYNLQAQASLKLFLDGLEA